MEHGDRVNLLDVLDELLQLPDAQRESRIEELGLSPHDVSRLKKWLRAWKIELIESFNPTWRDLFEEIAS